MGSFKEWLSKTAPEGAGEIWDNRSNADVAFGRTGAKSKNVTADTKTDQISDFDPDKMFKGQCKCNKKKYGFISKTLGKYGSC